MATTRESRRRGKSRMATTRERQSGMAEKRIKSVRFRKPKLIKSVLVIQLI
jgi:hypothetical protein